MNQNVVYLHEPPPIGRYLRVGSSGHRQLEILHGAGKLAINRTLSGAWRSAPTIRRRETASNQARRGDRP